MQIEVRSKEIGSQCEGEYRKCSEEKTSLNQINFYSEKVNDPFFSYFNFVSNSLRTNINKKTINSQSIFILKKQI